MNVLELIKMIESKGGAINIVSLKNSFSPIDLADKLRGYINDGVIEVDWRKGRITLKPQAIESTYLHKVGLTKKKVSMPEYMKGDKVETNKPFIPKRGE